MSSGHHRWTQGILLLQIWGHLLDNCLWHYKIRAATVRLTNVPQNISTKNISEVYEILQLLLLIELHRLRVLLIDLNVELLRYRKFCQALYKRPFAGITGCTEWWMVVKRADCIQHYHYLLIQPNMNCKSNECQRFPRTSHTVFWYPLCWYCTDFSQTSTTFVTQALEAILSLLCFHRIWLYGNSRL